MQRLGQLVLLVAIGACADDAQTDAIMDYTQPASAALTPVYDLQIVDATLGGTLSVGAAINNRGVIAGYSTLADNTRQAFVWIDGRMHGLGTLGGPSSAVLWPGINNGGMIVGVSFTGQPDPHDANWSCEAFMGASDRMWRGFVWDGSVMHALETLGGHNGFAAAVNNRGHVAGWAETAFPPHDDSCKLPQVFTFHAALWEPKSGTVRDLPPLSGDAASAATAINDRGQVVGISGKCHVAVGDSSARASVLWHNGVPREIPNLGGATWNTPMDINGVIHDLNALLETPGARLELARQIK